MLIAIGAFAMSNVTSANANESTAIRHDDYRNFFGISWIGTAKENLEYARQMGHTGVVYMTGMELLPESDGLEFYISSPEHGAWDMSYRITKPATPEQIRKFEEIAVVKDSSKPFPKNMATGWFVPPDRMLFLADLQQSKIIDLIIEKTIKRINRIQSKNPKFKFGGFIWDVPQPTGDFWDDTRRPMHNCKQVDLKFWTGKDSGVIASPNVKHDYPTYSEGRLAYYLKLRRECAKINPDVKFIIEPNSIYNDWIRHLEAPEIKPLLEKYKDGLADFVCEEGGTKNFASNPKNYVGGHLKASQVGCTTPNRFAWSKICDICADAAINGAWTGWYGRVGGGGDMPPYKSMREVPARLKLIRAIATWENLHNTPLSQRKWDGKTYSSPTAYFDSDVVWAIQPQTKKLFFVPLNERAVVNLPKGFEPEALFFTDGLLREINTNEGRNFKPSLRPDFFKIADGKITGNSIDTVGSCFIVYPKVKQI